MDKKRILVLFGGCSTEHEVSLQSAAAVLAHLDKTRYAALKVGITKEGEWLYYTGDEANIPTGAWQQDKVNCLPCALSPSRRAHELLVFGVSVMRFALDGAFPVLHGKNGEDGTVQGLIELAGIPLIGCDTLASALCMDKHRAHKLAALAGVKCAPSAVFTQADTQAAVRNTAEALGWPLFVKPVRAGSSFGVTRVERPEQLDGAVKEAFLHDSEVLLEAAVPGFEVGCAVLGNEALTVGLVDEIELSGGFFNYEEKYTLKTSRIHCPARIDESDAARIQSAAKTVYRALGCKGFARVDLFFTPEGSIYFNEVNTIPGFTAHSRYPSMMQGIGLDFAALVNRIVELGLEG